MMKEKAKGLIGEFKEFISRGNVMDMAVGVIVGTAFTAIVNSLVKDVITPAIGYLIGGIDFTEYKIVLSPAVGEIPETAIYYGTFIQNTVSYTHLKNKVRGDLGITYDLDVLRLIDAFRAVSYTHLDVYKRQHPLYLFRWNYDPRGNMSESG